MPVAVPPKKRRVRKTPEPKRLSLNPAEERTRLDLLFKREIAGNKKAGNYYSAVKTALIKKMNLTNREAHYAAMQNWGSLNIRNHKPVNLTGSALRNHRVMRRFIRENMSVRLALIELGLIKK